MAARRRPPARQPEPTASMRVVVLHGRELFLRRLRTEALIAALREAYGDVERFDFDGRDADLAAVLDELRSVGLFGGHKLVVLDEADRFLVAGGGDEGGEGGGAARRRALERYAAEPLPSATLLLRATSWRPGRLDKAVAQGGGAVIRCEPVRDDEAVRWCERRCPKAHGAAIDRDAAALLVERLGPDLGRLDGELAKLAAFIGDRERIGREDAAQLVGHSRQEQAWALQSAILSGRRPEACGKLRELLEVSGVPEVLALWAITDLLRRLHTAAHLLRRGRTVGSLRGPLRLFGPAGERLAALARRAEPRRLAALLDEAVRADWRSKRGVGDAKRNLEVLTLRVTDTIGCL